MAGRRENLKSFLENNPIKLFSASLIVIIGIVFTLFQFIYDTKVFHIEEKLKADYIKKIDLLDAERSRISVKIGEEKGVIDVESIFIDGTQLPHNYQKFENSPFAIPEFFNDNNWKWRLTNAYELIDEIMPNCLAKYPETIQFYKQSKIISFEKNEIFDINVGGAKLFMRPRITFEFTSREQFKSMLQATATIANTDNKNDTNNYKQIEVDDDEVTYFNVFFNLFTTQKDSRLSDYLGEFNISEYFFDKDVFLINGYYNVSEASNHALEKIYQLRMGFKRREGIYLVNFNMPISNDYKDVKLLNTLVHGFKIVR